MTTDLTTEPKPLVKRSFLKLPVDIDVDRLLRDYEAIDERDWGVSHWDVHCSIDVLLLRGGTNNSGTDFTTSDVANSPVLDRLPYLRELVSPGGPFGDVQYAFVFRTKPGGVTRAHEDNDEAWKSTLRVHVPIVSNPGAVLLAEGRSLHFEVGAAWTFDNQSTHSVVNGDTTRVHLIIDLAPSAQRDALLAGAEFLPGAPDPERWAMTTYDHDTARPLAVDGEPLPIADKLDLGLSADGFATRVRVPEQHGRVAALLERTPLRDGDVIVSVDGTTESPVSRTALDFIRYHYRPGDRVRLEVLRSGERIELDVRLPRGVQWLRHALTSRARRLLRWRPGR